MNHFRRFLRPPNYYSLTRRLKKTQETEVIVFEGFGKTVDKNKGTFLDMIKIYETDSVRRRGHVEFIYAAMKHMEEYGVHRDLEVYKQLVDVLPKGRFVPTNIFQAEFMHYPKQQQCIIDLLCQMEENAVMPDSEMELMLLNIFGTRGYPLRKFWRMMYWLPKFKNLSPWRLPDPLPYDAFELAMLAIKRISSVDNDMEISIYNTSEVEDSLDKTWIISAQSPIQKSLLDREYEEYKKLMDNDDLDNVQALIVKGSFTVYLRNQPVTYFTLIGPVRNNEPPEIDYDDTSNFKFPSPFALNESELIIPPSVHEQDDGTVLAMCCTGSSSRDSLLSWIRLLEKNGNPSLGQIPVVFTLSAPFSDIAKPEESTGSDLSEEKRDA